MTHQAKLFSVGSIVKIDWEQVAKDWESDDPVAMSKEFFHTEKGCEYGIDGEFEVTSVFCGGAFDSGECWATYVLKPVEEGFKVTDFVDEDCILSTVSSIEEAEENGAIFMENYNLKYAS